MLCMISIHECCRVGGSFIDELCGVSWPVSTCLAFPLGERIECMIILVCVVRVFLNDPLRQIQVGVEGSTSPYY